MIGPIAIVGCGRMGARHAAVACADPRVDRVWLVDPDQERACRLAERLGVAVAPAVPDAARAVVIAAPTRLHGELSARHLDAGRWVLLEKPGALRSAELMDHPRLQIAYVEAFNPAVRALAGATPVAVQARRIGPLGVGEPELDPARDLLVHDLQLVLSWRPDASLVRAESGPEHASATLVAPGFRAELLAGRADRPPERRHRILAADGRRWELDLLAMQATRAGRAVAVGTLDGLAAQWRAFADAVAGEAPVAVPAGLGRRVLALAEQVALAGPARAVSGQ